MPSYQLAECQNSMPHIQILKACVQFLGKSATKTVPSLEKRGEGKHFEEDFDISLGQN